MATIGIFSKSWETEEEGGTTGGRRVGVHGGKIEDAVVGGGSVGGYRRRALLSSFIGAFPTDEPRYVVFALLDEPKGTKKTHGYATGGWVAAPIVGRVVQKIGPIAGIRPYDPELPPIRRDVASNRTPGTRTLASY